MAGRVWLRRWICAIPLLGAWSCSEEMAPANAASAPGSSGVDPRTPASPPAAPESFALTADGSGWVAPAGNALGIQGGWATRAGTGSSITLSFAEGSVCFSGEAAQIPMGGNGAEYFG